MPSDAEAAADVWVTQNLNRDATHRREISQLQQERRIAEAGILPTSAFYSVKRIAEQMDLLLTFGEEEKVKKQLDFASTRLDEAAALIAQGENDGGATSLEEYRTALMAIATGTGTSQLTQRLVEEQVAENVADVSAIPATETGYVLKKAVLEASAALPDAPIQKTDVEAVVLVDTLDALKVAAAEGDIAQVELTFGELKPYLKSIKEGKTELSGAAQKEAVALLEEFAHTVALRDEASNDVSDSLLKDTEQYLPVEPTVVAASMTDAEIDAMIEIMKRHIFAYQLPRSRWNQLQTEFKAIRGNPDQGRILRKLYHALPEDGLATYVRTEIAKLKDYQEQ